MNSKMLVNDKYYGEELNGEGAGVCGKKPCWESDIWAKNLEEER